MKDSKSNYLNQGGFIKSIVAIIVIIVIAFLSQWLFSNNAPKTGSIPLIKKGSASYLSKADEWVKTNIYPKIGVGTKDQLNGGLTDQISGGLKEKEALLNQEIATQKNNLEKTSSNFIKKTIAEKILGILGLKPEDLIDPSQLVCPKPTL